MPLQEHWYDILAAAVPWYAGWDGRTRQKFENNTRFFVVEKHWEGCNGLVLDNEMKIVVSAQAAMMSLGMDDYCFEGIQTILVYPDSFRRQTQQGLIVRETELIGEAWRRGPIVLSWNDIEHMPAGQNVVVHELAHHLDGLDGDVSGDPMFTSNTAQQNWETVSREGYQRLCNELDANRLTVLDPYAATNRAEYFAVSCETFFEEPRMLKESLPDLYDCLGEYFNIDPARWTRK